MYRMLRGKKKIIEKIQKIVKKREEGKSIEKLEVYKNTERKNSEEREGYEKKPQKYID